MLALLLQELKGRTLSPFVDLPVASTNLKRGAGHTEDRFRDRAQLRGVNVCWLPCGRADLCEYNPRFNAVLYRPPRRSTYQWRVFAHQSMEFLE